MVRPPSFISSLGGVLGPETRCSLRVERIPRHILAASIAKSGYSKQLFQIIDQLRNKGRRPCIATVIPGLTRYPVDKVRRRRTLLNWTPDQVRGDGRGHKYESETSFGTHI
jgi:hypothetical protein